MELKDIKPKISSFKLNASGDQVFHMEPITLNDEIWLQNTFGDKLGDIFEKVDIKEISRIVYRLMRHEDKIFFKKQTVKTINEEGEEDELTLGGVQLLRAMISGWNEKIIILNALMENIGFSRPELVELAESDTKESQKDEKKSL